LRDAGYRTAGFYGGPYLHPVFGRARAFRSTRSPEESSITLDPDTRRRLEALGYLDP
jgi:hypothetical protein